MRFRHLKIVRYSFLILIAFIILSGCSKEEVAFYPEADRTISITENIRIDNGVIIRNPIFNLITYDKFLDYLSSSDHFLIVPMKDFKNTTSVDKVVISLRHDMDDNINAAVKFAYREHKYGIHASYYVLHTAKYYGQKIGSEFIRNDNVIFYLKKIQDTFSQEIGIHNDLVTLQIVYEIPPKEYLRNELIYLRGNGINIWGTTYHGSPYTYTYKYSNSSFWEEYPLDTVNSEFIKKGNKTIQIERDSLENYNFTYEGGLLETDYFFTDSNTINGERWNMNMVNLDTIKPGKKVIILIHPQHWD